MIEMGDKLPICNDDCLQSTSDATLSVDRQDSLSAFAYEELMEGSVPCPSCNGSGRIPKEHERQLVALIPYNDERLKPRRTTLYVMLAVFCSLILCGLCTFFLIPRSIVLDSSEEELTPYFAYWNRSVPIVKLGFINDVLISNNNFVNIEVINSTMKVINLLDSGREMTQSVNTTSISVPLKSSKKLVFNVTLEVKEEFMTIYCDYVHSILLQFDIVVTSRYLGHDEQSSVTTKRNVKCSVK